MTGARSRRITSSTSISSTSWPTRSPTIRQLYTALGRELTGATEERMRTFLADHPGDGDGSATRYRFADTGLDAGALRERSRPYLERFGVATEPVR